MDLRTLKPAERDEPEPDVAKQGWKGADVTEDELVDDDFIAQNAAVIHEPEKLAKVDVFDRGGLLEPGLTVIRNNTGEDEPVLHRGGPLRGA